MKTKLKSLLAIFAFAICLSVSADELERNFVTPPVAAKPSVWWYWGESVTTDHGITQDLEALKRAGFGGVVIYEQVFTDRPDALKSLSPEWLARLRFAAAECARLGLTLEVNVSDGYVAGGPWITPALGMQRLVASETVVEGGKKLSVTLPQPSTVLNFYRDVAVLAFPTPTGDEQNRLAKPKITSVPSGVDLKQLFSTDGKSKAKISPPPNGLPACVELDYGQSFTARSLTYSSRSSLKALVIATQVPDSWADDFLGQGMKPIPPLGTLEASDDGIAWRAVCTIPAFGYQHDSWTQRTVAFPATTAMFYRLKLDIPRDGLTIGGVALQGDARIDQWESKSGNIADFSNPDRTPDYSSNEIIDPEKVLDLSDKLSPDGKLHWDAPPGRWTILRLGHTPTGAKTKHGRPENMGLECDKLSATATAVQFSNYVGVILREVRKVPGAKLAGVNIDSAEHGSQNWTKDFEAQFEKRRGYSLRKYLPAMMGRVVGSRELSDKFLFDVRRTIADLMSDEHFGTFQKLCHAEGMTSMAEAPGIATCLPSDNIQAKGRADIPMAEFWMSQPGGTIDCKEAASAAHVYGLPVVAAEAFTGSRADAYPGMMKPFADAALALGINRFVVLAYVHQPWDDKLPGVTQDRFYVPYQRHNTWWEDSAGFWNSLSRGSQLMRQGHAVADILYHLGNDTPLKIATSRMRPAPPTGYDYDVCGDEVLIQRASVKEGRIVLPDGMSYRLLVLAGGNQMTLAAAKKLHILINAGATVLGPVKLTGSPTLSDGANGGAEVRRIADELWGAGAFMATGEKLTGSGTMLWGMTPAQALARLDTPPDFEITSHGGGTNILYAHRRTADGDIYFIANHQPQGRKFVATFRVTGRVPERWDADTGKITAIAGSREINGRTEVPLTLEANASTFVVFRAHDPASGIYPPAETNLVAGMPVRLELAGPWNVRFTPGWGAPEQVTFTNLVSWVDHPDAGVRNYSGAATYAKNFELPAVPSGDRIIFDLGNVAVLASVKLNGHDLGVVWKEPYALDVTGALKPGRNTLEVRVVNLWVNRLIADSGLPESERKTWVTWSPYRPDDKLLPSGLLGPIRLFAVPDASAGTRTSAQPIILTPKPPLTPRINGPKIFGVRPGSPFLFRIPATGERPMKFAAEKLPAGLSLDAKSGIITGALKERGTFGVTLVASNALGVAKREFRIEVGDRIALTPPMGWNTYYGFRLAISDKLIREQADAMVKSGLADHGWSYINLDEGWTMNPAAKDPLLNGAPREPDGRIRSNGRFPDMKALADYVHGQGLKIGLYSSPGPLNCGGFVGSYQHEEQDAQTYADWGFDFLKYDWCSYKQIAKDDSVAEARKPYELMARALKKTQRDIVFSFCQYGMGNSWEWAADAGGNTWRTTRDIIDKWETVADYGFGQAGLEKFSGPSRWNDPDMLMVGVMARNTPSRLTADEQYTHVSLWCLLNAPLLIGGDLRKLDEFTLGLLTNDEVIEVNQDPLGQQASRIAQDAKAQTEVWVKRMEDGSRAVGLFNRSEQPASVTVTWSSLQIQGAQTVRDLWRQKDFGVFTNEYTATVPAHGVELIRVGVKK